MFWSKGECVNLSNVKRLEIWRVNERIQYWSWHHLDDRRTLKLVNHVINSRFNQVSSDHKCSLRSWHHPVINSSEVKWNRNCARNKVSKIC